MNYHSNHGVIKNPEQGLHFAMKVTLVCTREHGLRGERVNVGCGVPVQICAG